MKNKIKKYWFRFLPNWYGICFTHKNNASFSLRNGFTKYIFICDYYIYIIKPCK